jgi:hypothetical protein
MLENFKSLTNRAAVVKVSSVINPLLWLSATVTPMALLAAVISAYLIPDSALPLVCLSLACMPPVVGVVAYGYWGVRDPDRLQSEEFQLKQTELLMVQKNSETPVLIEEARDVGPNKALIEKKKEE